MPSMNAPGYDNPHDTAPMPGVSTGYGAGQASRKHDPFEPSYEQPYGDVYGHPYEPASYTQPFQRQHQPQYQPQPQYRQYQPQPQYQQPYQQPAQPPDGPSDYEEYFWGEGTQVPKRKGGGCCSIVFTLMLCVALVAMLLPMTPINYDVLRGTSLHHLETWLEDSFGITLPEPAQEQLEAIYGQESRAEDGYFKADPPTSIATVEQAQHYYRSALTDHAATVYDALEEGLLAQAEEISLPAFTSGEEVQTVWTFVLYDHPEEFNLADDARVTYQEWMGNVINLRPEYKYPKETADQLAAEYESLAWELPLLAESQAETMENICAYVADSSDYVNSDNDQYIDSVFTNGESVCAGYAKAVQYLALRHGIPCIFIAGTADDYLGTGGRHAWLAALVDGEVRYYDPTWYDQRGWHADQFLGMNLVEVSEDHAADYPQLLPR